MKKLIGLLLLMLSLALFSCGNKKDAVLGSINQKEITLSQFKDKLIKEYGFPEKRLQNDVMVRRYFINLTMSQAFLKEGEEKGFFKKPETIKALKQRKMRLFLSKMGGILKKEQIEPRLKNIPDEMLKPFQKQVKVSHILISTKKKNANKALQLAKSIKAQLKKGASFKTLAAKYSDDPGSKMKGGDLGWITKTTPFVKPFLDAVFSNKYKKGDFTEPVKSAYGYHIIYLEDEKTLSIDAIKKDQSLMRSIQKKNAQIVIRDYVLGLRKKYASKTHININYLKNPEKNADKDLVAVDGVNSIKVSVFYNVIRNQLPNFKDKLDLIKSHIQTNIVDKWIIYLEALSLGLDKRPEVIRGTKFRWTVEKGRAYRNYIRTQFVNKVDLSKKALKDYYEKNKSTFSQPKRTPFAYEEIKDKVKAAYLKTFPKKQNPTQDELKKYYQMNVPKFGFKKVEKEIIPFDRALGWVKQEYISQSIRPMMNENRKRIMNKYKIEIKKQK